MRKGATLKKYPGRNRMVPGIALWIAAVSTSTLSAPVFQEVTEARPEMQIWTTYALNPYLRGNDLNVAVDNGNAILTGKVNEEVNKDLAKEIALGVSGIKKVDNQIEMLSNYTPAPPGRADKARSFTDQAGSDISDAWITAKVKSTLLYSSNVSGSDVIVNTKDGVVTLNGRVHSGTERAMAIRLADDVRGVKSVTANDLII